MALGVQLDLDPAANFRLEALAQRLDSIPGLATVSRLGDVHHVSLGIYDGQDPPPGFAKALARFAAQTTALDLPLAGIGIFPGRLSVLYLAPVVPPALPALHGAFHEATAGVVPALREHYRPGAWVPHVTLALDVAPEALAAATEIVRETWAPIRVGLVALRLIRFFPVETLAIHPLRQP